MAIVVTNQKPTMLETTYIAPMAGTFDPISLIKDNVVKPLFTPLIAGTKATIMDGNIPIKKDEIVQYIINCSHDTIDVTAESKMHEIFKHTLAYYDKALNVQDVYAVSYGKSKNMYLPSDRVRYQPADVIDTSKQFLAGRVDYATLFANFAFYTRVQTFGYFFANAQAFENFKQWFSVEIAKINQLLPPETVKLCHDLQNVRLNCLTESFVIRDNDGQNNDPYSFARILPAFLMMYQKTLTNNTIEAGTMPFALGEFFCPRTIVLINIERHAHATPNEVKNEWDIIKNAMNAKPTALTNGTIAKLTALSRNAARMGLAGFMKSGGKNRSAHIKLRKTPPTSVDLYHSIMKLYKHTAFVQSSENSVRSVRLTYQRPSRRDPDNPDRQGKQVSLKYKPDLHIYLDCSGSISERDYQDAIKSCIRLAKKMNINIYFNSFSHIMSQTTKLPLKEKSTREIYDIFKSVPKVGGGTDFEQIWHYINQSAKRQKELSLIITDMEWTAPNHFVKHPRFCYYAPISSSSWKNVCSAATDFIKSMLSICPNIRKHVMM